MIVKNEAKIIGRMLATVAPYIDAYCICDTGSTDDGKTVDTIRQFFRINYPDLPGKVVTRHKFVDFAQTRNAAFRECQEFRTSHVLFMDADMLLETTCKSKEDFISRLNAYHSDSGLHHDDHSGSSCCGVYMVYQGNSGRTFLYENVRITPNDPNLVKYLGVTHEYVDLAPALSNCKTTVSQDILYINDVGDGGSKGDKHERDIRLLRKGILDIEERMGPANASVDGLYARYHFYLGSALWCAGHLDEAKQVYRKRIQIGGWCEELYYSLYTIGRIEMRQKNEDAAVGAWLEASIHSPNRLECLYEIVKYYRCKSAQHAPLAYMTYRRAKDLLVHSPTTSSRDARSHHLFHEEDVYTHLLDYEFTVFAFYMHNDEVLRRTVSSRMLLCEFTKAVANCLNHFSSNDGGMRNNILSNMRFYAQQGKLSIGAASQSTTTTTALMLSLTKYEEDILNFKQTQLRRKYNLPDLVLRPSSTSILLLPSSSSEQNYLLAVTRFVNYRIDRNTGAYHECDQRIITANMIRLLDRDSLQSKETTITTTTTTTTTTRHDERVSDFILENVTPEGRYVGMEDVRIMCYGERIYFAGTTESTRGGPLGIGIVSLSTTAFMNAPSLMTSGELEIPLARCEWLQGKPLPCEKNWVFVPLAEPTMVYNWYPHVRVCSLINNDTTTTATATTSFSLRVLRDIGPSPGIFRHFRGSTNGVLVQNEMWFLVHMVSAEQPGPRHYYHAFVRFDANMTRLLAYTGPFKLSDQPIEYSIGMCSTDDDQYLSIVYSVWDQETRAITKLSIASLTETTTTSTTTNPFLFIHCSVV
jgi:hypothetical protein